MKCHWVSSGDSFAYTPVSDWELMKKDNPVSFTEIQINVSEPDWRAIACHELAHVLHGAFPQRFNIHFGSYIDIDPMKDFKCEILAERLAKSFCKPQYWDEAETIRGLRKFWKRTKPKNRRIFWRKFKIVELQPKLKPEGEKTIFNRIEPTKEERKKAAEKFIRHLEHSGHMIFPKDTKKPIKVAEFFKSITT